MTNLLRVLIVDDSDDDASLILRRLRAGGYEPLWERVDTYPAMKKELENHTWDIILCDHKMPVFSSSAALELAQKEMDLDIPFIIISGAIGEETAVAAMKSGAHDYLMKDKLGKLVVTVERELREAKIRKEKTNTDEMLKKSEENFRHSLDDSPMGIRIVTSDGDTIYANREILNICGCGNIEELKSTPLAKIYTPESFSEHGARKEKRKRNEDVESNYEISVIRNDGEISHLEVFRKLVLWNGEKQFQVMYNDITERRHAEINLRNSEKRYRLVVENAHESILITQDMKIVFANSASIDNMGYPPEILLGTDFIKLVHPGDIVIADDYYKRRSNGENVPSLDAIRIVCRDSSVKWMEINTTIIEWDKKTANLIFLKDITEHKLLDEERTQNYERIKKTLHETVTAIAMMEESRDPYTSGHQTRVSSLARAIAEEMGLDDDKMDFIATAALVHDIGKISIPSQILSKPSTLSRLEFELIKTHPHSGYNIFKNINFAWPVADVIQQHHERLNGSGYPDHLEGENILLESRIIAVADVVEAISSHRPYRPGFGIKSALEEITENKGILYDSNAVDACLKLFTEKNYSLN